VKVPDATVCLPPAVGRLIELALDEDLGRGDVTSEAIFGSHESAQAIILAKSELVLSGLDVAMAVFQSVDARLSTTPLFPDGSSIHPHTQVMRMEGPLRSILAAERTALNFLQRLSGIATLTRRYVHAVAGTSARIVDTRKTAPGFRFLDKRAVRHGGAHNHRADSGIGRADQGQPRRGCGRCRRSDSSRSGLCTSHRSDRSRNYRRWSKSAKRWPAGVEILLLDNMSPELVRESLLRLPSCF
jgi:nicotinate-nucleotide pyrophosphorylase (carboxylating)